MAKANGHRRCTSCNRIVAVRLWGDLWKHRDPFGAECPGDTGLDYNDPEPEEEK